jgi:ssDNA-binding Zn-finger/Zn-ribbon topoisomerase 1
MPLTLIQLIGEQTMQNLVPLLALKPARVVQLCSQGKKYVAAARHIEAAAREAGVDAAFQTFPLQSAFPDISDTRDARQFWLVPSASPDSVVVAEIVRDGAPADFAFQPWSAAQPFRQIEQHDDLFVSRAALREVIHTARQHLEPGERLIVNPTSGPNPRCPQCGKLMALRTARAGKNAGRQFWGSSGYPECKGVVEL